MSSSNLEMQQVVAAGPAVGSMRERASAWLSVHSVAGLRVSLGLVLFGFGALKFFPGASPAEALVMRTVQALTLGLVDGRAAVVATAALETFIGLTLITGIGLRLGLALLFPTIVGMLSPLVLFPGDMFPGHLPTLEAQYVLKDIVFAAAAAVVATHNGGPAKR
jgi:hypothetical protein